MQTKEENPDFLKKQIITYLGNKRKIITHIDDVVSDIRADIGRDLVTLEPIFWQRNCCQSAKEAFCYFYRK